MKSVIISLLALALLAGLTHAAPDSLACRMIDWMDEPGTGFRSEGYPDWPPGYDYSGTAYWDLAMGDSFMVWLPGSDRILVLDAYEMSEVDTIANFDYGSVNAQGVTVYDSMIYILGGGAVNTLILRNDSLIWIDTDWTPFASYHFAALEDSFLYTIDRPGCALTCINVADPESIFIYRTYSPTGANAGLEVIDGYLYNAFTYYDYNEETFDTWVIFTVDQTDMLNSPSPVHHPGVYYGWRRFFGDIASDGERIFFANTYMGPWPDWPIGGSDFYIQGDTSYNFDAMWDGQPAIGVEIINDHLAAVGFKHGFSILDIDDFSTIHEVAYYMDPDSLFYFTHFAMKDTVLYAVAHPRDDTCRLYMFHLAESVASGQAEAEIPWKPEEMKLRSYPNPFNSSVRFAVEGSGVCDTPLRVEIYDVAGRKIAQLPVGATWWGARSTGQPPVDPYEFNWRPDESIPSGIYLARIDMGAYSISTKLVYLM
jgi:hypothetical protein